MSVDAEKEYTLMALLETCNNVERQHLIDRAKNADMSQPLEEILEPALIPDPKIMETINKIRKNTGEDVLVTTILSPNYPKLLAQTPQPPPYFYYKGNMALANSVGVSVVGSRKISGKGIGVAREITQTLISNNVTTISGLAEGVDTIVHETTLQYGGNTIAVIGTGISEYYPPQNRALQDTIAEKGLLISQFNPNQKPSKQSFPQRNKTIVGLSAATIIIEAGEYSGTRNAAKATLNAGRPLILTKDVTENTIWGAKMVGTPGVLIVSNRREVEDIIHKIKKEAEQWK